MSKHQRATYEVTVRETNEIAGELFTHDAVVRSFKTFSAAKEWCLKTWGAAPPVGAKIRETKDGAVYAPFGI